jgi:hypothetical protein
MENNRIPQNLQFTFSNSEIEIVKELNYLGLLLTKTGNFKRAIKTLADKGTKARCHLHKAIQICSYKHMYIHS